MSKKFLGIARLFIFSVFLFLPTVVYAEIFFQDDFESGVLINQQIWEWIANNPNDPCYSDGQIVPTTEDKFSGVYSAKFTLPSGDMCTSMYSQFSRSVGQGEDIYFRFRLKYLANREWNLGGGDKVAGFFGNSRAPGGEWILFTLERGYHDTGIVIPVPNDPHMAQPLIYVAAANTNGWRPCNDPEGSYFCQNIDQENPFYMTAGQWYTVEIYVKVDAYGAGQLKLWINGKQLIDINNIYTIRGATNPGFYRFELGGTLNQPDYVFPVDTVSYWDDVIISDTCNSCDQPSAQITSPTNSGTYTTTNSTINLSGTATDPAGTNIGISSVIYSNDRGGSGNCSGTTSWACDNISLQSGQNIITVTAIDGDNKTGVDTLVVTVTTSGGGSNNNGSSGGEASGGSGCGFVKDNNGKGPKSQGIGGESGNISIIANLALLFLFLTLLKLRVIFYGNMGGYRMKINKLFSLLMLSLAFFLQPSALNAAVNLPWSTTYNCPDWTQSNGLSNITCDGLSTHGGWTCSNGDGTVEEEQITVAANYSGGSGGKGQRHWKGDGTNNVSGGLRIAFNSPQSELWIRWYMRYEQGFEWNPLVQDKILYIDVGTHPFLIFGYNWPDEIQFSADGNPYSVGTGNGWNTIMVNGTTDARGNKRSDGQWHLYEIHIKMDTNGSNGIGEAWIDGIRRFYRSDMNFGSQTGKIGWSHIAIGENNQIPTTTRCMYVDFDDIIISTTGPIGGGVDAQAPSVPAGLTAQAVSSSQINLSWTASTDNVGVAGYRVYRNGSQIDTTSTTSYSNTGLSASTTYTYSVSAYDAVGNNSAQTSNVSATTQAQAGGGGGDTGGNTGGGDASGGSGCGFVRDSSSNKVSESQSIRATDINLFILLLFLVLLRIKRINLWHAAAKNKTMLIAPLLVIIYFLLFPYISFGAILFQEDFEDVNFSSRGWYDSPGGVLSATEHISGSAKSFECRFQQGGTGCSGGAPARHLFSPTDEVYVSYYVKYNSNWTGSNKNYHPHEFLILTNLEGNYAGPAYTHLTAYIEQNEGIPLLALQDGMNIDTTKLNQDLTNITEQRAVSGCNGVPSVEAASTISCYPVGNMYWNGKDWRAGGSPNSHGGTIYFQDTPGPYYKSDWHRVEAYFKLNSIANGKGVADGILRYWYDGNLIIERTNIIMRTGQYPNMKFNQFMIAPWIGDGSPIDQTMWVDNLTVGTSRDGDSGGGGGGNQNTGGDTSSSSGSGCGYIKDNNGKGQGAKGEGVALIMMLVIALAGMALVKRAKRLIKT